MEGSAKTRSGVRCSAMAGKVMHRTAAASMSVFIVGPLEPSYPPPFTGEVSSASARDGGGRPPPALRATSPVSTGEDSVELALQRVEQIKRLFRRQRIGGDLAQLVLHRARLGRRFHRLRGEQRQVVDAGERLVAFAALLQRRKHLLRARDDGGRKARELGDMDAIGAVGGAGRDLVQEDDG